MFVLASTLFRCPDSATSTPWRTYLPIWRKSASTNSHITSSQPLPIESAHKLGHRIRHADIFRRSLLERGELETNHNRRDPLGPDQYLESQANGFAGLFLVGAKNFERGPSELKRQRTRD